jgi:hypothetical protein
MVYLTPLDPGQLSRKEDGSQAFRLDHMTSLPAMTTNDPLVVLEDEIRVEYRQFGLQDEEAATSFHMLGVAEEGLRVGGGCAAFASDGNDHYPLVRFECWSGEPPAPPSPWDAEEGVDDLIDLPSGIVRLWSLVSGPSEHAFTVGPAGRYRLRVHVRSFMTAVAEGEVDPDDLGVRAAERWLLRFWQD